MSEKRMQKTPVISGSAYPLRGLMVLVTLVSVAACDSHRAGLSVPAARDSSATSDIAEGRDLSVGTEDSRVGSSDDASAPDASAAETSESCETMQFEGTLNRMTFAEALRSAQPGNASMWGTSVELRGAKDTKGLECFDGMIKDLRIIQCGGPLHITSIPRGTLSVAVDGEDCPWWRSRASRTLATLVSATRRRSRISRRCLARHNLWASTATLRSL